MTDDKRQRAGQLHLDGEPLDAIARALGATVEWVRGVLGLDSAEANVKPKSETPPAPAKPYVSPASANIMAAAAAHRILNERLGGGGRRSIGDLGPSGPPPGYQRIAGGGTINGSPYERIPGYVPSLYGGRGRRSFL